MRSAKDIERSLKQADLDVDVNTRTDRAIQSELVDLHREASWRPSTGDGALSRVKLGHVALAAVVMITIVGALFIPHREPPKSKDTPRPVAMMSAAEMLTVGQLKAAYHRGGLGALAAQCEKAAKKMDVKSERLSIGELIVELED